MKPRAKSQDGIALLATMMALALMTVLVVDFTYSATEGYRSAANQMNELKAEYLGRSGVQVGLALLARKAREDIANRQPYDSLKDIWAAPFPAMPVEGGAAGVSIVDESRKFNINQLVDQNTGAVNQVFLEQLQRLFTLLQVPPEIIPAIVDWIDPDSVVSQGGAEADYYLGLKPPYEPRNGPMPTIGDLKMVRGVDESTFTLLKRFLTVAPDPRINVNTASAEVLMASLPEFANDPSLVKEIISARDQKPFKTVLDVNDLPGMSTLSAKLPGLFSTQSDFFTITGLGSYAGARKLVYAVVRRTGANNPLILASWHED